jgi:hypothetical protein
MWVQVSGHVILSHETKRQKKSYMEEVDRKSAGPTFGISALSCQQYAMDTHEISNLLFRVAKLFASAPPRARLCHAHVALV